MTQGGLLRWFGLMENYLNNEVEFADGLPDSELALLSDQELRRFCDTYVEYERQHLSDAWTGFMTHGKETMSLLGFLLYSCYPGFTPSTFADVSAGSISQTATHENHHLWPMSRSIRASAHLTDLFAAHPGAAFFDAVRADASGEAVEFAAQYQVLLDESGHRGSSDRDIIFPTRSEHASNDYAALKALTTAPDEADPALREPREPYGRGGEEDRAPVLRRVRLHRDLPRSPRRPIPRPARSPTPP